MNAYNINTFERVMAAVGMADDAGAVWRGQWAESERSFPDAAQPCLQPDWIEHTCRDLGWPDDVRAVLLDGLKLFDDHPDLRRLLWHCRHVLFDAPYAGVESDLKQWPMLPAALHPAADLFYAYVFLAGLPAALARHAELGVSMEVSRATFADLPLWLAGYREKHGRWGLDELNRTGWLYGHLRSRLFRLGRLQFRFEIYKYQHRVYRKTDKSQTIMLAGANEQFRPDGQYDGANGIHAGPAAWRAILTQTADSITGHPMDDRNGIVMRDPVTFPARDWQPVLAPEYPVLGIHIPAGAPLTPDACTAALRQAAEFFPRVFPDCAPRVFTCTTWLFDPQFARYLPPESNIVRFQRAFHLFPVPRADDRQTLERVFGRVLTDPAVMPRQTSLQRVVADHMVQGGRWYLTGGFMLMDSVQ